MPREAHLECVEDGVPAFLVEHYGLERGGRLLVDDVGDSRRGGGRLVDGVALLCGLVWVEAFPEDVECKAAEGDAAQEEDDAQFGRSTGLRRWGSLGWAHGGRRGRGSDGRLCRCFGGVFPAGHGVGAATWTEMGSEDKGANDAHRTARSPDSHARTLAVLLNDQGQALSRQLPDQMADTAPAAPATSAAPPASSSSTAPPAPTTREAMHDARSSIRAGDNVLLKLPSGVLKPIKLNPASCASLHLPRAHFMSSPLLAMRPTARSRSASTAPSSARNSSAGPTATRTRSATTARSRASRSRSTRSVRPRSLRRRCGSRRVALTTQRA